MCNVSKAYSSGEVVLSLLGLVDLHAVGSCENRCCFECMYFYVQSVMH